MKRKDFKDVEDFNEKVCHQDKDYCYRCPFFFVECWNEDKFKKAFEEFKKKYPEREIVEEPVPEPIANMICDFMENEVARYAEKLEKEERNHENK